MPKIKFSGLVSGMSGKANGSVFATNNSGNYFRTNASKTKKQTASNGLRKSNFSNISQRWRTLTEEDQQTWIDGAINFPRTNVFGDIVYPSGFGLFMQLNTALGTQKLPYLSTCPMPRLMPDPGEVELNAPDEYQFIPQQMIATWAQSDPSVLKHFTVDDLIQGSDLLDSVGTWARFDFSRSIKSGDFNTNIKQLFRWDGTSTTFVTLTLLPDDNGLWIIRLTINGTAGSYTCTTDAGVVDLSQQFHIGFITSSASANAQKIYLNGSEVEFTGVEVGTDPSVEVDAGIVIGTETEAQRDPFIFSDLRVTLGILSSTVIRKISKGYVIGNEIYLNGLYAFNTATGSEPYINDGYANLTVVDANANQTFSIPNGAQLVPILPLEFENAGSEGMIINVYASPNISKGRAGNTSNFKLIASLPYESETEFDITQAWEDKYSSWSAGGTTLIKIFVMDTTTGAQSIGPKKPKKRPPFKAGAELSGAVN